MAMMEPPMRSTKPIKLCWLSLRAGHWHSRGARAAVWHIAAPKNLTLPLPLPGQAAAGAALLPHTVSSGLVTSPPCTAPLPWYPAMFYPLFHCYLPAQKAGAYLLAKDFLLGSWRQIIVAVSNNV